MLAKAHGRPGAVDRHLLHAAVISLGDGGPALIMSQVCRQLGAFLGIGDPEQAVGLNG